jgi:hypothetical protein
MRKSRIDPGRAGDTVTVVGPTLEPPWPDWVYDETIGAVRTANFGKKTLPALHYLARDFSRTLYALRLEHSCFSIKNRFYAFKYYVAYLAIRPKIEWAESIGQISDTELARYSHHLLLPPEKRPYPHSMSNKTVSEHLRLLRSIVKDAWRLGIAKAAVRPNLGRTSLLDIGRAESQLGDEYSQREYSHILQVMAHRRSMARGTSTDDERSYLAASGLVIMLYTPANVSSTVQLNEDSLRPSESDQAFDVLTLTKERPRKSANRVPEPKEASGRETHEFDEPSEIGGEEAEPFKVIRGRSQIRRVFNDNIASNEAIRHSSIAKAPLFLCRFPGKSRRESVISRITPAALGHGLRELEKRYPMIDDAGKPLRIVPRKLRRTYENRLPKDMPMEDKASVMNHQSVSTTAESYEIVSDEDHYTFSKGLQACSAAVDGRETRILICAASTGLSEDVIQRLAHGMSSTFMASCADPTNGRYAPKDGSTCRRILKCFGCPSFAVAQVDLYRLASFSRRIELDLESGLLQGESRAKFSGARAFILEEVFPLFEMRHIVSAQKKALKQLHPVWERVSLAETQ